MIALLGAILGFVGSVVPDLLKILQDKRDKAHELKILELQRELQAQGHSERMAEIDAKADIAEAKALYTTWNTQAQTLENADGSQRLGVFWVDALNGTVRPVLAYGFFLLYATVKFLQWQMMPDVLLPWHLQTLWGDEDRAIFSAIIAFYFGARAMKAARKA